VEEPSIGLEQSLRFTRAIELGNDTELWWEEEEEEKERKKERKKESIIP